MPGGSGMEEMVSLTFDLFLRVFLFYFAFDQNWEDREMSPVLTPRVSLLIATGCVVLAWWVIAAGLPAPAAEPANYQRVCQPEVKPAFLPLPPGAVEPAGWLRDWAISAREGITGHLDEYYVPFRDAWKGVTLNAPGGGSGSVRNRRVCLLARRRDPAGICLAR